MRLPPRYGIREVEDVISRRALERLHEEGNLLASFMFELVGMSPSR